ncbi:hypothetical protein SLEP1_g22232 [Rubroshorea leprosula]|uniref:Small ribosomal subunit protein uS5 C-terminal domain-containing protein n=1 Tax=Rubroshorea leprosula TaxID=152421 RepID=A0AAV5J8J4_9ROSI|nr:hypothetical protein SLEP1_g22232 [Rubroshorea leprosula]
MLRPASPGTGVIARGAVRIVLEMAGVENALGKQIGSKNALNNARATVVAVQKMRPFRDVARERGNPSGRAVEVMVLEVAFTTPPHPTPP